MSSDFIISVFAHGSPHWGGKDTVQLGQTPARLLLSMVEGCSVRILTKPEGLKKIYDFGLRQCDIQCRPLVQNRRVNKLQCFSIERFCLKISSGWSLEKNSRDDVFVYVCLSVRALSPLEPEWLVGPKWVNILALCQNGRKTMVPLSDQSVARDTCHVRSR